MSVLKVHASACDIEPMVQSEEIRRAFVARIKKALSQAGISEWGAGARLAEMTGKTAKAASKWLNGESMPGRANMVAIADGLGVRVEWLQYGEGEMLAGTVEGSGLVESSNVEPGPEITSPYRAVKIVGTAQMGAEGYWYALDEGDGVVDVPSSDPDAYALRLRGDSMAPAIRSGWVAVVEPSHRLVPGEYVMIRLQDGESMLKELLFANEAEISVMSINDAYGRRTIPTEQIEHIHYVGTIVAPSKIRV